MLLDVPNSNASDFAISTRTLRILLIERDPWDQGLLEEAFEELRERQCQRGSDVPWECISVEGAEEGIEALNASRFHLILLDVSDDDRRGLETLFRLREAAPDCPIVVLAREGREAAAMDAVREGADEYLLMSEIDAAPLERRLRGVLDRRRREEALRNASFRDPLTGLYNRQGLAAFAAHDARVAQSLGSAVLWLIRVTRPRRQYREDAIDAIGIAELLRRTLPEADTLARTAAGAFAAVLLLLPGVEAQSLAERVREAGCGASLELDVAVLEVDPALEGSLDRLLCDNN